MFSRRTFSFVLHLCLLLAAPLATAGTPPTWLGKAKDILERGTHSGEVLARAIGIEGLAYLKGLDIDPYLRDALTDPRFEVRIYAAKAVAILQRPKASILARSILRNPNAELRVHTFDLLSAFPRREAHSLLLSALLDRANKARSDLLTAAIGHAPETSVEAIAKGLGKGDQFFASYLEKLDERTLERLLPKVLGATKTEGAKYVLKVALERHITISPSALRRFLRSRDEQLRYLAAETAVYQHQDKAAVKVLEPLARGPREDQLRFLRAAAAAPSDEILPALKELVAPDTPKEQLVLLYKALAGTSDQGVKRLIEKGIGSTDFSQRLAAAGAIGRALGRRALPMLYKLLRDGNPSIRLAAAKQIGELGQSESIDYLQSALQDTDPQVRRAVVDSLGMIRDKAVLDVVRYLVYDSDPVVQKEAIVIAARLNHPDTLSILRNNTENRDPEIRKEVLKGLLFLDLAGGLQAMERAMVGLDAGVVWDLAQAVSKQARKVLEKAVSLSIGSARQGALRASAILPPREHIDFLKAVAATNEYADTRKGALARLVALSCPTAAEVAQALIHDQASQVRIAAAGVLADCSGRGAEGALVKALDDEEEVVRVAAARALVRLLNAPTAKKAPKRKVHPRPRRGRKKHK